MKCHYFPAKHIRTKWITFHKHCFRTHSNIFFKYLRENYTVHFLDHMWDIVPVICTWFSSALHIGHLKCECRGDCKSRVTDVYYLSQNICAVPMEGIDFSIKGVNMSSTLHRARSWTILLCTHPLTSVTHTDHTHNKHSIQFQLLLTMPF